MAIDVEVPDMGESVNEVLLVEWLKADGDYVEVDEPICIFETDKADVEFPAPASGLLQRLKPEGETVPVGEMIARIDASAARPQPAEGQAQEGVPPKAEEKKAERSGGHGGQAGRGGPEPLGAPPGGRAGAGPLGDPGHGQGGTPHQAGRPGACRAAGGWKARGRAGGQTG
ncbi:MAG: hypothetical protein EXS64_16790 [Candidatus Latescibacteria bacterium]|nr:hypothetical protein [Candidatus Latescibacterota bacterium]